MPFKENGSIIDKLEPDRVFKIFVRVGETVAVGSEQLHHSDVAYENGLAYPIDDAGLIRVTNDIIFIAGGSKDFSISGNANQPARKETAKIVGSLANKKVSIN